MEDLLKLESDDTHASRDTASKIQYRLKGSRDPSLLGQLVDFYFQTYSKRARKILTTLRETHSQDFFDKLNDCLWSRKILPVFKLLAHALNSQQTTWLYRIVDHPLFTSILQLLEESEDVMVLTMGVLVVAAILPLVPTYINCHLQCLFHIFSDLATIRTTKRLGLTPHELVLHLDVSVYYLFLQLYALFPCNLFSYFKSYCENGTRAQVNAFQEYIAPLFYQVQLHPGLVTDSCTFELSKAKWGAMDPSDIATHSIQLCVDSLLTPSSPEEATGEQAGEQPDHLPGPRPTVTPAAAAAVPISSSASRPSTLNLTPPSVSQAPPPSNDSNHTQTATTATSSCSKQSATHSPTDQSPESPPDKAPSLSDPPNPGGLKTSEELCNYWSPSVSLGHMTLPSQGQSAATSHRSSRTSVSHHSQQAPPPSGWGPQDPSTLSSPNSDSAFSSVLHTPAPVYPPPGGVATTSGGGASVFSYKNYSPTASVDGESLFSRGGMTQSAIHTPGRLEESLSSTNMDPLSQSVMFEPRPSLGSSPTKSLRSQRSIRNRLEWILGKFRREEGKEGGKEKREEASEDYIELFVSDAGQQRGRRAGEGVVGDVSPPHEQSGETVRESLSGSQQETRAVDIKGGGTRGCHAHQSSDTEGSGRSDSPVNSHRQSGLEGVGQLEALEQSVDIDMSALPPGSNRPSHSNSEESSQTSLGLHQLRQSSDSPNTAGAGHFDSAHPSPYKQTGPAPGHSYKEVGASATCELSRMSSSYPTHAALRVSGVGQGHGHTRSHTSTSEAELGLHAQLQERLQRLVEDREPEGSGQPSREGSIAGGHTPVLERSGSYHHRHHQADTRPLYPPGHTLLAMRRLSVCSRKGIALRLTSESSSGGVSTTTPAAATAATESITTADSQGAGPDKPLPLVLHGPPSPLALLDQFVSCGEVLHRGNLDTIPLTEQEGVDWNHFGGCPHSEEFRIMQSQMVLLHSQLLFERYQCVQHAKRNRRLLSKARSAAHVTEELVSLRDQLHQQEALVSSLQQQLRRMSEGQSAKQQCPPGSEGGGELARENASLRDSNTSLREELWRMQERNRKLEEELKCSNKKLGNLSHERQQLEPRLQQASQLQAQMSSLSRRHQQLEELCQQERDRNASLQAESRQGWEWRAQCEALRKEKEEGARRTQELEQALRVCRARLEEVEGERQRKLLDLERMRVQLEQERSHSMSKMKALEDKYGSMKVIGQQLECHVMELKSRPLPHRKKPHPTKQHRRNPSYTSSATNTPSPIPYLATPTPITA